MFLCTTFLGGKYIFLPPATNVDDFIKYIYKSYTYNYQGLRTKYVDINEGWTTN